MKRSPEVKSLILEWYQLIAAGDMVAAAEHILSDEQGFVAIGTEPAEWMENRGSLIAAYREIARRGSPEINVRCIEAYREGTVAWAADVVVMKRPNGVEKEMRHTFVLHQENGQWKVVHAHYSFGIPEEYTSPAAS